MFPSLAKIGSTLRYRGKDPRYLRLSDEGVTLKVSTTYVPSSVPTKNPLADMEYDMLQRYMLNIQDQVQRTGVRDEDISQMVAVTVGLLRDAWDLIVDSHNRWLSSYLCVLQQVIDITVLSQLFKKGIVDSVQEIKDQSFDPISRYADVFLKEINAGGRKVYGG
jgi:hypothetical protein